MVTVAGAARAAPSGTGPAGPAGQAAALLGETAGSERLGSGSTSLGLSAGLPASIRATRHYQVLLGQFSVRNLGLYVFHGQWFVGHVLLSPTMSDDVLFFPFVCHAILQAEMRVQNQHKVTHVQETNSSTAAKVSGQSLSASCQYDNPA